MDMLFRFLETIDQWHWFGFAALLTILEVVIGANFFLLWLGVCAASIGFIIFICFLLHLPW